jgi:2-phosphosulfolactate phosphatase
VDASVEQEQYQVRFDWGVSGARAIGSDADVVVLVDVLGTSVLGGPGGVADALSEIGAAVVAGSLRNCAAIANWSLAQQAGKGDRFRVAVVAVGETRTDGTARFALEDLLGAGAIIDALAVVGIDYYSPEAAAAAAAFTGLRNATGHLIGASTSGRAMAAVDGRDLIEHAIRIDASSEVQILREFSFDSQRFTQ